jgi:CHAT domain-containing protein/tetratricopeptide (TPR) repeat protein
LFAAVLVILLAFGLPPAGPDCDERVETIQQAVNTYRERGVVRWPELERQVAEAHRCYGEARTAAHAALFGYETYLLVEQRRFADAEAVFERFFAGYAGVAAPDMLARMYLRRGFVYGRLGWTVAMLAEYARAAAMAERLPAEEASRVLSDAGERYRVVNDLETAARYFASAESLLVRLYAAEPAAYGQALGIVRLRQALALLDEGDLSWRPKREAAAAAAPLLESALTLIPATPDGAFHRAYTLLNLAVMHWALGEPEAALEPIAEAHRLSPWFRDAYPQLVANRWRKEGHTQYLLGRYDAARRAYETALAEARAADERDETWRALVGLGEVAEAEAAGGQADGLRRAEGYFRQAAALVEEIRRSYGTHDWSASAWETVQEPYLHLTRVLLRQGRAAEAFLVLDETRARYLRDLRTSARLRERLGAVESERLDGLFEALDDVRYQLGDPALPLAAQADLQAQETILQREVDALVNDPGQDAGPVTLEAVQDALRPRGQVLLTYFLDDAVPTAFVVRPDTFVAVPLRVTPDTLRAEVDSLGGLWAGEAGVALRLTPLHALYRALYAPVAPLVPEGAPLVVVPDGPLTQVPFGLLLEREHPPFAYADAPYLLRRHAITVELAAALLTDPAPPEERPLGLLALGRSRFGGLRPSGPADRSTPALGDLPHVEEELRRLQRRVGGARIALDEAATEAFLDARRDEARVIHLASHALVDAQLPLYSRVVLWDGPPPEDDGTLYLYELQRRPLHADLVTLSGCSTARGRSRLGEGMMGLQYAFRAAGARATLATLWQVEDAATAELMDRFYLHLRRGLPKDEALRQAQLAYLGRHPDRASPFFWAAPVLYGDPAPVPLAPGAPPTAVWIPVGLLLLGLGLALPRLLARREARMRGNG